MNPQTTSDLITRADFQLTNPTRFLSSVSSWSSSSSSSTDHRHRTGKQIAENAWHWKHYHEFKTPNFNDYPSLDDFDHDDDVRDESPLIADKLNENNNKTIHQSQQQQNWNLMSAKSKTTLANQQKTKQNQNGHNSSPPPPPPSSWDHLAQLSCDSGEMILRLNFSEPFKGIVYPDNNRLSPCRFFGDGHHNYELRLPLRGCGTKQVSCKFFSPSSQVYLDADIAGTGAGAAQISDAIAFARRPTGDSKTRESGSR